MKKQKEFKEVMLGKNIKEVKMSFLGNGRGIFGLRKSKNTLFIIITILGILSIAYGIKIQSFLISLGAFAIYLMIIAFLARD